MRRVIGNEGMTLIEVVVVAFLVAVLSAILYKSMNGIMRSREVSSDLRSADQTAHYVFGRLTSELSGRSFVPLNIKKDDNTNAAQPTFGVVPKYLSGTAEHSGESDHDTIRFVSANAAQAFVGGPANHGVVEVEYHLADNPDLEDHPMSGNGPKPMVLVREEEPAAVAEDVAQKRRIILPLAENVLSLKFRYLKGGEWQNDWKETNPPLPEAIEISLRVREDSGKSQLYRTAIPISAKPSRPANQPNT